MNLMMIAEKERKMIVFMNSLINHLMLQNGMIKKYMDKFILMRH